MEKRLCVVIDGGGMTLGAGAAGAGVGVGLVGATGVCVVGVVGATGAVAADDPCACAGGAEEAAGTVVGSGEGLAAGTD